MFSLVETFLDIKLDTERLQNAKQLFEEGKFKEAGGSMGANEMTGDLESLLNERDQLQKKIKNNETHLKNNANEFLILAKLTAIDYALTDRFEKALEYFEMSIKAERNYENISSYAEFLLKHDRNIEAEQYFQEAVEIVRELVNENSLKYLPELVKSLNSLGGIQRTIDQLDESEKSYHEALEICRSIADDGQDEHLAHLGEVLHSIGVVYRRKHEYDSAKNFLEEALEVRRKLANDGSEKSLDNLANSINSLAVLLYSMGMGSIVESLLQEAKEIRRKLGEDNPNEFLGLYAHLLTNIGDIQYRNGRDDEGKQSFQEAIKFLRDLSETNPQQYLSALAAALLRFVKNLLEEEEDFVLIEGLAYETLSIYRNLAEFNDDSWLDEVADSLFLIGKIKVKQHQSDEAEIIIQEAKEIYCSLFESNPILLESYAFQLGELGIFYHDNNYPFEKAEGFYKESVEIYRRIAESGPKKTLPELVVILESLAFLYEGHNKKSQAKAIRKEISEINKNGQ